MKAKAMVKYIIASVFTVCALVSTHTGYSQDESGYTGTEECMKCHPIKKKKKEKNLDKWKDHAHAKLDKGCEVCHGPGKEHAALGAKELTKLKKKKGDLKIVLNKKSSLCGECHKRTDDDSILLHSGVLVKDNQQYTEMLYNKHTKFKVTCIFCHDAHAGLKTEEGIKRKCLDCHKDKFAVEVKIAAMSGLSCEDCHMPYAARKASDETKGEYRKGDALSHIFGISSDPDYSLDDGSGKAAITDEGFARLTVEQTCYACHKSGGAKDISREELLEKAKSIH